MSPAGDVNNTGSMVRFMRKFIIGAVVSLSLIGGVTVAPAETAAEWMARIAAKTGGTVVSPVPGVYVGTAASAGGPATVTITADPGTGTATFICNFAITPPACVRQ